MAVFIEAWRCPKCRRLYQNRQGAVTCCPNVALMTTGYLTGCGTIFDSKGDAEKHEEQMQGTCAQALPHVKDGRRLDQ